MPKPKTDVLLHPVACSLWEDLKGKADRRIDALTAQRLETELRRLCGTPALFHLICSLLEVADRLCAEGAKDSAVRLVQLTTRFEEHVRDELGNKPIIFGLVPPLEGESWSHHARTAAKLGLNTPMTVAGSAGASKAAPANVHRMFATHLR